MFGKGSLEKEILDYIIINNLEDWVTVITNVSSADEIYKDAYALLLTYTILGVETGILDIQVILYFIIGLFIYLVILIKNRKFKI